MTTAILNNGTFTTRTRTYQTTLGTLVCTIQHCSFYSVMYWSFKPTNSSVAIGNLKKRSLLRFLEAYAKCNN
jgi:hypothetical protein